MWAEVHFARQCDVFLIANFWILMYCLKPSLVHRPRACISHFGQAAAAPVDAPPMRNEWEEILASPSVVLTSNVLTSFPDRKRTF